MTKDQIQAIGNFLMTYQSDLDYIKVFQDFKNNKITASEFEGTFLSFLIEFRVARNFSKGEVGKLLNETVAFIYGNNPNDVDLFAEKLSKSNLTRSKVMTSLCSKILFLNNPWEIIPMDTLARRTLNQKENKYCVYLENLKKYNEDNKLIIENCMNFTNPLTIIINNEYKEKIKSIDLICKNRITDKLLWTNGKQR